MELNYELIPEHCRDGVQRYIEKGHPVGHFLTYVFENNLVKAFEYADDINRHAMYAYAQFLYNVPMVCYGSKEKREAWQAIGGQEGFDRQGEQVAKAVDLLEQADLKIDADHSYEEVIQIAKEFLELEPFTGDEITEASEVFVLGVRS